MAANDSKGRRVRKSNEESLALIKILEDVVPVSQEEWDQAGNYLVQWAMDQNQPKPDVSCLYNTFLSIVSGTDDDKEALKLQKLSLLVWTKLQKKKDRQFNEKRDSSASLADALNIEDGKRVRKS